MPEEKRTYEDLDKLKWARKQWEHARSVDSSWQREAEEDFEFHAGHQWDDETLAVMDSKTPPRPHLTLNLIKNSVDLLLGVAEQNRVNVKASPVDRTDEFLTDIITDLEAWARETFELEDEEDDTFENALICGRGFMAQDIESDQDDPEEIVFSAKALPHYEVRYDPASTRSDLSDAKYIFWTKWLSWDDFKDLYPKYRNEVHDILYSGTEPSDFWFMDAEEDGLSPHSSVESQSKEEDDYDDVMWSEYYDRNKYRVKVCHMEYVENYKRYYGFNPQTGETEEFDIENLEKIKTVYNSLYGPEAQKTNSQQDIPTQFEYTTVNARKIKWLQFIGHRILFHDDAPIQQGFSVEPIFTYKDKSRKGGLSHFGIVRMMKDPQREVNKRWSQALYLLLKQGAGIMAESDAFENLKQAQAAQNNPDLIMWLKPDAGAKNKVPQPKPVATYPEAALKIEELMQEILKKISGINPDLLGQDRGRQEPGVVVRLRQQQGMTILARLFKSFKKFKKRCFERRVELIMRYMPDSQILRILGENERYSIENNVIMDKEKGFQADLRDLRHVRYNVKAEEAPGNLNKSMAILAIILEMMAKGFPVDPETVIDKLEIPLEEKTRWKEYIAQQSQQQQGMQQAEMQLRLAEVQMKQAITQADVQTKQMEPQIKAAEMQLKQLDAQTKAQSAGAKFRTDQAKAVVDVQKTQLDAEQKKQQMALDAAKFQADNQFKAAELVQNRDEAMGSMMLDKARLEQDQFQGVSDLRMRQMELGEEKKQNKRQLFIELLKLDQDDQQFVADILAKLKMEQDKQLAALDNAERQEMQQQTQHA